MVLPLVGRAREAGLLAEAVDRLLGGRGSFLHFAGEAGVGKTRLLNELTAAATLRGVTVLHTAADETDRLRAWSTVEVVLGGFDRRASDPFDWALRAIEAMPGPLAIVADDVQWADTDSLNLLRMVARRAAMLPVLLVTAARLDPMPPAVRQIDEFARRYSCRVQLEPLCLEEIATLLGVLTGDRDVAQAARLVEGTAGNPFLVSELLQHGTPGSDAGLRQANHALVPIDATVVARVMGRMLHDMDEDTELLVRLAAALPSGFSCAEVAAAAHRPAEEVVAWASSLVRSGVLVEHGHGLGFRHSLLRDIVRQSTPVAVTIALRKSALAELSRRGAALDRAVLRLLDGFDANDASEIATALSLAARARSTSPTACADLLAVALTGLSATDPRQLKAVVDLGWSLLAIGRADEVPTLITRFFGDRRDRLPVELLSLEGSAMALAGRIDLALRRFEGYDISRIEAEFDTSDPAVIDAMAELASGRVSTGDLAGGLALLHWVEQSPTRSSPERTASIEATRALSCSVSGRFKESMEHAHASLRAIAQGTGPMMTPAGPVVSIALGLDLSGDSAGALATLRNTNLPGVVPTWTAPFFQFAASIVLFRRGDWDDALAEAEAGLAAADEVGMRLSVFWPYAVSALIRLARNQRETAAAALAECVDEANSRSVGTEWLTFARSMLQAADGEVDTARATLEAVCRLLIDAELDALLLGFGPETARLAVRTADRSVLPSLEEGLDRLVSRSGSPVARATAVWVGGLARQDGAALVSASEEFAALSRRPDSARAAADAAVTLQAAGETVAARRLAKQAFDGFDRLGAEADHARLRADLRRVGLPVRPRRTPRRPAVGWLSLTPSEHAVVDLVAAGLTNGEIGDRLFVSRRTVESHLVRVFAKVNVSSRTQLIAARQSGAADLASDS